jgi:hypothetical protein
MTRDEAQRYAEEWAAAWNVRDVEAVLAHFSDDVSFTSPTALKVVGTATVHGKPDLRAYWNKALSPVRALRFSLDRVAWDPASRELAIVYLQEVDGHLTRVSENLTFGADGKVASAEVFHGLTGIAL